MLKWSLLSTDYSLFHTATVIRKTDYGTDQKKTSNRITNLFPIVFVKGKKMFNLAFFPDGNLKSCVILPAMSCPRSHMASETDTLLIQPVLGTVVRR